MAQESESRSWPGSQTSEHPVPDISAQEGQHRPPDSILPNIQLPPCIPGPSSLWSMENKEFREEVSLRMGAPGHGMSATHQAASGVQAGPLRKEKEPQIRVPGPFQDMFYNPQGRHFEDHFPEL